MAREDADAGVVLGLIERALRLGAPLSRDAHELRISALATQAEPDLAAIVDAVRLATRFYPDDEGYWAPSAAALMLDAHGSRSVLDLLSAMGRAGVEIGDQLATRWLAGIAQEGTTADAITLVESIDAETALVLLVALRDEEVRPGLVGDRAKAQLAYRLGGEMWRRRQPDALELYRLALRLNPRHAFAANDLGYFLLEEGGDLDEVERLLEIALAGRPDNASVLDSVGWLRYVRGRLEDEVGPGGEVVSEGALTLLTRALDRARVDPDRADVDTLEIREHLGDAQWRAGRREQAVETWERAREIGAAWLGRGTARPRDNPVVRELAEQVERLAAKVDAGVSGGEPAVAPTESDPAPGGAPGAVGR